MYVCVCTHFCRHRKSSVPVLIVPAKLDLQPAASSHDPEASLGLFVCFDFCFLVFFFFVYVLFVLFLFLFFLMVYFFVRLVFFFLVGFLAYLLALFPLYLFILSC